MTTDQVNYLNIGLMILSAISAFLFPFETFLFVYAFLGPLHYLTEISWLHDRHYFTKGKYDYLFLIFAGLLITAGSLKLIPNLPANTGTAITFIAFSAALIFVFVNNPYAKAFYIFLLFPISAIAVKSPIIQSLFSVFLPSIIHVFLFTGLFILVGALRGKSLTGIASLVVFIICAVSFFLYFPESTNYTVSERVKNNYADFQMLNYYLMAPFSTHNFEQPSNIQEYFRYVNNVLYQSRAAFSVMAFIGFAYMYHYLNWFSKTSIIQWHNISRTRLAAIIIIWLASIGLYAYDYKTGLKWLFFLSFSHVLLEFPLNHLTFATIGKELRAIFSGQRAVIAK